jgi:hypothetical protein
MKNKKQKNKKWEDKAGRLSKFFWFLNISDFAFSEKKSLFWFI